MPPVTRETTRRKPLLYTSPSDLASPAVLRQILLHCDDDTLTRCMRVSYTFYDVAGPILYHEISLTDTDVTKLFLGHAISITSRAPKGSAEPVNLKQDLLNNIRVIEISYHTQPHGRTPLRKLPRLRTLRILTKWWCTCPEQRHFELCQDDCEPEERGCTPCPFRSCLTADKVVLATVRDRTIKPLLTKLKTVIHAARVLTVIINPDTFGCTAHVAASIRTTLESAPSPIALRIILAPLSHRIARHAEHESLALSIRGQVGPLAIEEFCHRIKSDKYFTTIFFAEGFSSNWFHPKKPPIGLNPPAGEALHLGATSQRPGSPEAISFKTRLDYVKEGVVDEIDPEQLAAWREEERKLAEVGSTTALNGEESAA